MYEKLTLVLLNMFLREYLKLYSNYFAIKSNFEVLWLQLFSVLYLQDQMAALNNGNDWQLAFLRTKNIKT